MMEVRMKDMRLEFVGSCERQRGTRALKSGALAPMRMAAATGEFLCSRSGLRSYSPGLSEVPPRVPRSVCA